MDVDVTYEEASSAAERDLRLQRVIEILAGNDIQMIGDARAQRVRQIDLLTRYRDLHHASPRLSLGGGSSPGLSRGSDQHGLVPPTLHRIGDAQRLAIFGHGSPGNVHALVPQRRNQSVI